MYWEYKEQFLLYEDSYPHWTIFAVEDGSFYYEIEGQAGTASLGDLVFCPPRVPFRRVIVSPLTFHFIRLQWEDLQGNLLVAEALQELDLPIGKVYLNDTNMLHGIYRRMKAASTHGDRPWEQKLNHSLVGIWFLYCEQLNAKPPTAHSQQQDADLLMTQARQHINEQAFDPFHIKDLAASIGLTPTYFSKRFKIAYGIAPIQYLTSLRLEKAKMLLLDTHLNLDQISECCGYQNGYYLNRVFTKQIGTSPVRFRKKHRV
jgi:AraC-like DNA-binding protein